MPAQTVQGILDRTQRLSRIDMPGVARVPGERPAGPGLATGLVRIDGPDADRAADALADAGAKKKLPPEELASLCAEKVSAKIHKSRRGGADHAQRIEKICEAMTGQKIIGD